MLSNNLISNFKINPKNYMDNQFKQKQSYYTHLEAKIAAKQKSFDYAQKVLDIYHKKLDLVDLECIKQEEVKRKKRNDSKIIYLSEQDIQDDLDAINGVERKKYKAASIAYSGGILKINGIEYAKGDEVKCELHGEVYEGKICSINYSEVSIKTQFNERVKIQFSTIRAGRAIVVHDEDSNLEDDE